MAGGGVGVLDRGKLATSRLTDRDRIDPNVWSGDRLATADGTMPLLIRETKRCHGMFSTVYKKFEIFMIPAVPSTDVYCRALVL